MRAASEAVRRPAFQAAAVALIAAASAVGGALSSASPVGSSISDRFLAGALAAVVAGAGAVASVPAIAGGALVLAAFGGNLGLHVLGFGLLGALAAIGRRARPAPVPGALIAAAVVQGLLRLPYSVPARGSAAVAAIGLVPILVSAARRSSPESRRVIVRASAVVGAFIVLALAAGGYIAVRTHALLDDAEHHARIGVDAARAADRTRAAEQFDAAERDFRHAASLSGAWWAWPARQTPLVAPQVRVIDRVLSIGARTLPLATSGVRDVDPDRMRLVDGRIDLGAIARYRPVFDRLSAATFEARSDLGDISTLWLFPPLRDAVVRFQHTVVKADESARTAHDAITLAPQLLGGDRDRVYLVLFVTPAEARGSGGFISDYGVLTASNGKLQLGEVNRVRHLDESGLSRKHLKGPAEYLARYEKFDPANTWENVTMSPDFPSVADVVAQLYPQSGGVPLDGVIRLDPVAMSDLLALTGPVELPLLPEPLDSKNTVDFLFHGQYDLGLDQNVRADLLGDIAKQAFDRLTHGRGATPSRFAKYMSPALAGTNLALWFPDPVAQRFVRRINADASVAPLRGDSFGVITQNGGSSKIDAFLHRRITYTATVDPTSGRVRAQAKILLINDAPPDGLPDYVIGNQIGEPTGTNRSYLSVYSPFVARRATVDGRPFKMVVEREFGRNVYSGFVDIAPKQSATVVIDLDGTVDLSSGHYRFDGLSQVLPNTDTVDWTLHVGAAAKVAGVTSTPGLSITLQRGATAGVETDDAPVAWAIDVTLHH